MWTRKDINDFKETITREEGDAIIKVKLVQIFSNIYLQDQVPWSLCMIHERGLEVGKNIYKKERNG